MLVHKYKINQGENYNMNKDELVKAISVELKENNIKVNQDTIRAVINGFTDVVIDTLKTPNKISIAGFGVFSSKVVEAHEKRNPATGETVMIPDKVNAKFLFGKTAKDIIAQG